MKYKVCEECGAHLDSNETCECKERKDGVNEIHKEAQAWDSRRDSVCNVFLDAGRSGGHGAGESKYA